MACYQNVWKRAALSDSGGWTKVKPKWKPRGTNITPNTSIKVKVEAKTEDIEPSMLSLSTENEIQEGLQEELTQVDKLRAQNKIILEYTKASSSGNHPKMSNKKKYKSLRGSSSGKNQHEAKQNTHHNQYVHLQEGPSK
eukprot:jgi/Psemu1/6378/gm1.6378_g